jgi:hypothetical protein
VSGPERLRMRMKRELKIMVTAKPREELKGCQFRAWTGMEQ